MVNKLTQEDRDQRPLDHHPVDSDDVHCGQNKQEEREESVILLVNPVQKDDEEEETGPEHEPEQVEPEQQHSRFYHVKGFLYGSAVPLFITAINFIVFFAYKPCDNDNDDDDQISPEDSDAAAAAAAARCSPLALRPDRRHEYWWRIFTASFHTNRRSRDTGGIYLLGNNCSFKCA